MRNRIVLPIGTEVEVYDPEASPDDMPVYSGGVEDAFMSIEPGLYPAREMIGCETPGVDRVILIVTLGESFAVSTDVEYDVIHHIEPSGSGPF